MSIQELAPATSPITAESLRKFDSEQAKEILIAKGFWTDIEAFANGINPDLVPQIQTGFLKRNGGIAAAVVLWSSTEDGSAAKAVRVYKEYYSLPTVEFVSNVRRDEVFGDELDVFWQDMKMNHNEAVIIPLKERLGIARTCAGGRMPIEKIFD